jgi:hypothetical protein
MILTCIHVPVCCLRTRMDNEKSFTTNRVERSSSAQSVNEMTSQSSLLLLHYYSKTHHHILIFSSSHQSTSYSLHFFLHREYRQNKHPSHSQTDFSEIETLCKKAMLYVYTFGSLKSPSEVSKYSDRSQNCHNHLLNIHPDIRSSRPNSLSLSYQYHQSIAF